MKQHKSQTVGIFTGGGTAPGLNHAALGATLVLQKNGHTVLGLPNGYDGLLGLKMEKVLRLSNLTRHQLVSLFSPGGSELGSSRTKITPGMHPQVEETVRALGMDGIVAIGGDDTLKQALELHTAGIVNAVGVPKTIDNDVDGTERTFGFDTAVEIAAKVIRRIGTDSKTMGRVGIVEVMGRGAGHITLEAGVAGGAHITLIREFHIPADALIKRVEEVFAERGYVLIALAEAYNAYDPNVEPADSSEMDPHGHAKLKDAGRLLEKLIKERTKLGTQLQVVGYNVRSSEPLALDGNFARDLGAMAGHLAHTGQYGKMASLINGKITSVDLAGVKGGRNVTNLQYDQKLMMKRDEPPEVVQQLLEAESSVLYGQI